MPKPRHPECLLARHELGIWETCREIAGSLGDHRGTTFNEKILPMCQPLIEAIGHRMAYEAALDAGVDKKLLDVYESGVVQLDSGWYVECVGLTRWDQLEMEERAVTSVVPFIDEFIDRTETGPVVTAPILSEESWEGFVRNLELHSDNTGSTLGFFSSSNVVPVLAAAKL